MFQSLESQLSFLALFVCCGLALWKGGPPERGGARACVQPCGISYTERRAERELRRQPVNPAASSTTNLVGVDAAHQHIG